MIYRFLIPLAIAALLTSCWSNRERVEPPGPDPTCDDGIQNQGEEDIDCGGPCLACYVEPQCNIGENEFNIGNTSDDINYPTCSGGFDDFEISGSGYSTGYDIDLTFPGRPGDSTVYEVTDFSSPGSGEVVVTYTESNYYSSTYYQAVSGTVHARTFGNTLIITFCDITFESDNNQITGSANITVDCDN